MKICIEKIPDTCLDCIFINSNGECIARENKASYCIENCRRSDCVLQSIKEHDKELIEKIYEKIKVFVRENSYFCGGLASKEDMISSNAYNKCLQDVLIFIEEVQKEFNVE